MGEKKEPGLDAAYSLETAEENLQLYRDWASTYDEDFAVRSGYRFPRLVAETYVDAGGTWPVLDAGCGTGLIADYLPADAIIDGVDISPDMLERAKAKGRYRRLDEVDLTKPIPHQDAAYAGLVSAGTFTHGHVGAEALPELMRVMRSGAICTISGNPTFYESAGFKQWFEDMAEAGVILTPTINEEPIYESGASPPEGHENDIGLIIQFRVA